MHRRIGLFAFLLCAPSLADPEPPRLSLIDAVRLAVTQNPTAQVAAFEIQRAEGLVKEARALSLPTLAGNAAYTRLDDDRVLSGRVLAGRDSLAANVVLTVPLIAPKSWTTWSHASSNLEVSRATSADVQRQIGVAAARAYLAVFAQKRLLAASQNARDTAKAHFEFANARLAGGVGNRIDEVRAAQELATDEAQLQNAMAALTRTREALGVITGSPGPLDVLETTTLPGAPSQADAIRTAEGARPDVVAARGRASAADSVVHDSWTDYAPLLNAVGQPFYQNPPSLTQPLTGWQAQLVLSVPFYDGGLRSGQKQERDALAAEAHASVEGALRQARSEVRTAFEALERADRALVAARDAWRLAKEARAMADLAYRAGATTNLEVTDAERRERDAEVGAAVAEDASRQARLDVLAASGTFP